MIAYLAGSYHYKSFNIQVVWIKFNQEFHHLSELIIKPIVGHEHINKIRNISITKNGTMSVLNQTIN